MNRVTEAKKATEANLIARREETTAMCSEADTAELMGDATMAMPGEGVKLRVSLGRCRSSPDAVLALELLLHCLAGHGVEPANPVLKLVGSCSRRMRRSSIPAASIGQIEKAV